MNMKHIYRLFLFTTSLISCLLAACSEDERPDYLLPSFQVNEATEVTRTSALLTGEVILHGNGTVSDVHFRYGTTESMEQVASCPEGTLQAMARLNDLQPGTTYYFCLEASNGYSAVHNDTQTFTTLPNKIPTVSHITRINQSPLSITVSYEITDNGGETITSTGLYYYIEGSSEEQCLLLETDAEGLLRARISGLQMETDYVVQAFAANSIGETRSDPYHFHTSQAVILTEAGDLPEAVGEDGKYSFTTLSIAGPLNGTDFFFLRDMMGRGMDGKDTPGQLQTLNLSDASIEAGGSSYDGHHYTTDRCAGNGLFAQCTALKELILPDNTETVEVNAFDGCSNLQRLRLSSALAHFSPSAGCINLAQIEVPASCTHFSTTDGVLYNADASTLLWFPEGKADEQFTVPSGVQVIGDYAFRNAPASEIFLPQSVTQLGQASFSGACLVHINLPDGISTVPYGCFQSCTRLESVVLGKGTSYLSEYCFKDCPALGELYVQDADFPPYCTDETFAGAEQLLQDGTLHVPAGSATRYRNHRIWGLFKTIVADL